jgi:hypothetical protein
MTNREKLLGLRTRLGWTRNEVAEFLARRTKRPCALRTVQAWEGPPEKETSRPCPDWAIELLEAAATKAA